MTALVVTTVVLGCSGSDRGSTENPRLAAKSGAAGLCAEHGIAEAECPFCHPDLIETAGFCDGHGVPEALCYQCKPALIIAFQAAGDWCAEHDRPESQCPICNPSLEEHPKSASSDQAGAAPPETASETEVAWGGSLPRRLTPPSVRCDTEKRTIRFDGPEIAEEAGLEFASVEYRPITEAIECNAELAYDGGRYARVSTQMPGIIAEVHKDFGESVEAGEALVTLRSGRLGAAKATYLQAVAVVDLWERNHEREEDLLERGVSTEKDLLEAETYHREGRIALSEAEQTLRSFDLSEEQIASVRRTGETSATYVVKSPFDGIVVDRQIALGEVVEPSEPLYSVADVSRMWAFLDVYEKDLRHVRIGQPVILRVEGLEGETFAGFLTWVSAEVDPRTRTLRVRADFDNSHGLLRAHMFGRAAVAVREHQRSLVVPTSSVQWEGCCNVVFVKMSETVFQPRKVRLGIASGGVYEVAEGVEEGEEVVTRGSFLLKTEILKGSIGAGCCEVEPGA